MSALGKSGHWGTFGSMPALPPKADIAEYSGTLPDSYKAETLPIVNEQLERAGVRLAVVLNASLK
jgi:hypothetical protein